MGRDLRTPRAFAYFDRIVSTALYTLVGLLTSISIRSIRMSGPNSASSSFFAVSAFERLRQARHTLSSSRRCSLAASSNRRRATARPTPLQIEEVQLALARWCDKLSLTNLLPL